MTEILMVGGPRHGQKHMRDKTNGQVVRVAQAIPGDGGFFDELKWLLTGQFPTDILWTTYKQERVWIPNPWTGKKWMAHVWLHEAVEKEDVAPMLLDAILRNTVGVEVVDNVYLPDAR